MLEIKDEFKSQIKELDEMLYYDPEELKRIGEQQIREEERKRIVKNMVDNDLSDDLIMKSLNITFEELQNLKQ